MTPLTGAIGVGRSQAAERISRSPAWSRRAMRSLARLPAICWVCFDLAVAVGCAYIALGLHPTTAEKFGPSGRWLLALAMGLGQVLSALSLDLYSFRSLRQWSSFLPKAFGSVLAGAVVMVAVGYFVYYGVPGRKVLGAGVSACLLLVIGSRMPFLFLRDSLRSRILFIGTHGEVEDLERLLLASGPHAYELVAVVDADRERSSEPLKKGDEPVLALCKEHQVDEIVLSGTRGVVIQWFDRAVHGVCLGCRLTTLPDLLEQETQAVPIDLVDAAWLLGGGWDLREQFFEVLKRVFDICLGLLGMVLCLPLYLLIGLLIRLTTRGPVFYSQVRVGRFGKPFRIWKFRSMRVGAEPNGAQWAEVSDGRVEWYGSWLRKTRLDETPQFLNMVLGNMSFVGPRPERPEFVAELEKAIPFYGCRHLVRPGLTGWAQVNYRYGASVADAKRKLQYDLFYVRHLSLGLDLITVLRTVAAMARGAR